MIVLISLLQFTIILDFMVMAPLGAILIRVLHISPSQFGWVVSVYAFSAGISGILAAGFADKFDRKKMLLFFYAGFVLGTFLCGIAPDYSFLLMARMITGIFGGVLFSVNMAIIADLFSLEVRGRVMGFVQMSFAVSQVAGIPVGLFFASQYGWHMPFLIIVGLCLLTGIGIIKWMRPVTAHLKERAAQKPLLHLARTATRKKLCGGLPRNGIPLHRRFFDNALFQHLPRTECGCHRKDPARCIHRSRGDGSFHRPIDRQMERQMGKIQGVHRWKPPGHRDGVHHHPSFHNASLAGADHQHPDVYCRHVKDDPYTGNDLRRPGYEGSWSVHEHQFFRTTAGRGDRFRDSAAG